MDEKFSEYDLERLKESQHILQKVLEYYYGYNPSRKYWRRLDTIVIKLNELIEMLSKE